MEPQPGYVKVIRILGLYVFPFIIFALLMVLLFVPAPKQVTPGQIDAQIQELQAQKAKLLAH